MLNNTGPQCEPCSTPGETSIASNKNWSILTNSAPKVTVKPSHNPSPKCMTSSFDKIKYKIKFTEWH